MLGPSAHAASGAANITASATAISRIVSSLAFDVAFASAGHGGRSPAARASQTTVRPAHTPRLRTDDRKSLALSPPFRYRYVYDKELSRNDPFTGREARLRDASSTRELGMQTVARFFATAAVAASLAGLSGAAAFAAQNKGQDFPGQKCTCQGCAKGGGDVNGQCSSVCKDKTVYSKGSEPYDYCKAAAKRVPNGGRSLMQNNSGEMKAQ
jgi:hypothetical protein